VNIDDDPVEVTPSVPWQRDRLLEGKGAGAEVEIATVPRS